MAIKAIRATIKLGDIELDAYQLPDNSYASPGLFRLLDTVIYRYEGCWYWLSPNEPLPLVEYEFWDIRRGAYLSFQGNKLSYRFLSVDDDERDLSADNVEISFVPVPNDINAVIDFCIIGKILSDEATATLIRMVDKLLFGNARDRLAAQQFLLRDTAKLVGLA